MLSVQMLRFVDGFFKIKKEPVLIDGNFGIFSIVSDLVNKNTGNKHKYLLLEKTEYEGQYDMYFYDLENNRKIVRVPESVIVRDARDNPFIF